MKQIKFYMNLYVSFIRNTFARELDYRVNFIGDLVDSLANFLVSIIFFDAIYLNTTLIAGWGKCETLFLVGTAQLITSLLYTLFMNNLPRIQSYVISGDLDYILLKPCDEQFYVSFRYFYFGGMANIVPSVLLILYSIHHIDIEINILKISLFLLFLLSGLAISYSLWLIVMTCAIYFIKINQLHELFISSLKFIEYPGSIYKGFMRILLTYIVPFISIANIPVEYFLNRISFTSSVYIIVIAIIFIGVSRLFWKKSLAWYQSASS